ncbi:uncharacterized protein LOC133375062 isoform X2 [Rhineura floridana]|uniref:uncharacterized protein LOC133375062 isoform X2 n=1 Tax=Rhineura floridana TaxID=261503 RepID=UPI002AC7E94D|nr:uncharacterized protein LOC133375062 isoform X2 [Rhineura floridana]
MPVLIKSCSDNQTAGKFACKAKGQRATLKISNVQTSDSGLYFCAQRYSSSLYFSNGSTSLIVGDSYTPSAWVMLLQPRAQDSPSRFKNQLACLVHGASSLVQVSWGVPGDIHHKAQTLLVKNNSGSLTFVSLLHIPEGSHTSGKNFTCEVRFNFSGPSVKKSAVFDAGSSAKDDQKCLIHKVSLAVLGMLASLLLSLEEIWLSQTRIPHQDLGTSLFRGATGRNFLCPPGLSCKVASWEEEKARLARGTNQSFDRPLTSRCGITKSKVL